MNTEITLDLVKRFPKNGPTDPIAYYSRPIVGWLYRERINRGLRLLPDRHYARALEIGFGAGAVQAALSPRANEIHGIDLDADPQIAMSTLQSLGVQAHLRQGNAYELPYENGHFDLVASFSTFEHLHDYPKALREVRRVLQPKGHFLLGMPAVNKMMEIGFRAIGFRGINDHHVTTPAEVERVFADTGFALHRRAYLSMPLPNAPAMKVYFHWLLQAF